LTAYSDGKRRRVTQRTLRPRHRELREIENTETTGRERQRVNGEHPDCGTRGRAETKNAGSKPAVQKKPGPEDRGIVSYKEKYIRPAIHLL